LSANLQHLLLGVFVEHEVILYA